ncbi:hypothetical protein FDP41_002036 [Naegleria fowleri]|uniref:Choline transporter-like protein n=1 Tax=Naegleria fowleri TaxID=5763 RepID=A0A6A5BUP3_NAEFO|nr:uncharacterized protein FDP41_002036 [Naegleria fowleri]KAF0978966.1 hypothetical protein FDP41_002036 [Naegleria fowleri]
MPSCPSCFGSHSNDDDEPKEGESFSKLDYNSDDDREPEDPKFKPNFNEQVKYNPQITRVKKKGRWPTDIPCLILFVLYCLGMFAVAIIAWRFGTPSKLYYGTDYMGRTCGQDNRNASANTLKIPFDEDCINSQKLINNKQTNTTAVQLCEEKVKQYKVDFTDQSRLWFMEVLDPFYYGGLCVSYCPGLLSSGDSLISQLNRTAACPPELQSTTVAVSGYSVPFLTYCSGKRVDSPETFPVNDVSRALSTQLSYFDVVNRCIPTITTSGNLTLNEIIAKISKVTFAGNYSSIVDDASQVVSTFWDDVTRGWKVLVAALLIAIILGFATLLFIRIFAGVITYLTILICILSFLGLGAFMTWYGYSQVQAMQLKQLSTTVPNVILWSGVAVMVIGLLLAIASAIFIMRIRRAIGIIQESSKSLMYMPQVLLLPVVFAVIIGLFAAYWCVVSIFLYSAGDPVIKGGAVQYVLSTWMRGILAYHIFGGLWILAFIQAMEFLVLSGSVASWYWRREKRFVLGMPVVRSFFRTVVFHTGTAAFGSLIVAIVQAIRLLFEKIQRELETASNNNRIVKGCGWYVRVVLWIIEKVIKFFNRQAYVQTSMYGTGFLTSAKNAFLLMLRNPIQMAITQSLSTAILLLSRLAISCLTCLFTYGIAAKTTFLNSDNKEIQNPIFLAAIAFIIGFAVSSLFCIIIQCAIDTVLQCFLIELEMRKADPSIPRFCTKSLNRYIEENIRLEKLSNFICPLCCCLTCMCCSGHSDASKGVAPPVASNNIEMPSAPPMHV